MKMQSMAGFKSGAQAGFTLIELVVVIVILGILAATALPKFVDLSADAYASAAQGIAGGLSSGNAVNASGCAVKNNVATTNVCVTVTKCSDVANLISPPITIVVGTVPNPTIAKTIYLATDTSVTGTPKNGTTVTCAAKYGDGSATGLALNYSATGAGNP